MKHVIVVICYVIFAVAFVSCKNEEGDPGPAGEQGLKGDKGDQGDKGNSGAALTKAGYFEGTVTGKRQDGVLFSEPFRFEYKHTDSVEGFVLDEQTINLTRFGTESGANVLNMNLQMTSNKLVQNAVPSPIAFIFGKELSADKFFKISVRPFFSDYTSEGLIYELSDKENARYKLNHGQNDNNPYNGIYYYLTTYEGVEVYQLTSYYSVYYSSLFYRRDNGRLLAIQDGGKGEVTSGPLFDVFNEIKLVYDEDARMPLFYRVSTNVSLAYVLPTHVPADELSITNYKMDNATGVVTFDFDLKVSAYRNLVQGENTTGHAVTVKGKFNSGGKVYKEITGRIAGE